MSKRAAIYCRMSSAQQEDSPERQLQQIAPYCKRKGYLVVATYQDLAWKGYDDDRPEFKKLLAGAENGEFDVLVVDEVSRLARNEAYDFIAYVAIPLRDAGIELDTVSNGLTDWVGLPGQILTLVGQHKSKDEVTDLSRRVVTGMIRRLDQGKMVGGKLPYGYKKAGEEVVIDELPAGNVRSVFSWYVWDHLSLFQTSQRLDRLCKSPRGGKWSRAHVRNILTNPFYVGDWVFNRKTSANFYKFTVADGRLTLHRREVPKTKSPKGNDKKRKNWMVIPPTINPSSEWVVRADNHPAIIDRETFRRAGELLAGNRDRRRSIKTASTYVASGLVYCDACGKRMVGTYRKGVPSYTCASYANHGPSACRPYSHSQDDLVEMLLTAISSHYGDETRLELLRQEAARRAEDGGYRKELAGARAELAVVAAKLKKGWDNLLLLDADMIPEAKRRLKEWEAEVGVLKERVSKLESSDPLKDFQSVRQAVESNLARLGELGGEAVRSHPERLRVCLRDVVAKVTLAFNHVPSSTGKRIYYRLGHADVVLTDGAEARVEPSGDEKASKTRRK